jgi:Protein of unknown function (DUF3089)
MWKWILTAVCAVAVAIAGVGFVYGQRLELLAALIMAHPPDEPFDASKAPPAPDYSQRSAWASLPDMKSPSDAVPPGEQAADPATAPVDVFFIYPTSYFSNEHWNAAIDDAETNARTDSGSLRAQASAFNGCCRIYAPRYRQMTFGGFIKWSDNSSRAMALAYMDVKTAFQYYLAHYNHGRPFIIASHSQGSRHATALIPLMIDGTPLMKQFVGAYVVGTWLPQSWFDKMHDVKPCERANDIRCVVTWSTLLEGSDGQQARRDFARRGGHPDLFADQPFVCINPLSWSRGKELAPASRDLGGWIPGREEKTLPVVPNLVSARCDNGGLFVSKPDGVAFNIAVLPGGNYHNYDYQLAWLNIRKNAVERAHAFLNAESASGASAH